MSDKVITEVTAVKIREEQCSSCATCVYLCPFDAVKTDKATGKTLLEIEKCQVCGLCYSTCPAKAIDTLYYDVDSLTRYLEKAKQKHQSDTLVVMCKGSSPDFTSAEKLFGLEKFIPLSVPCVGRVPEEIFLKAMLMGIKKLNILACDTDYCRFERGSAVTGRKVTGLNMLLDQLGYGAETITFKRNSLKVTVDANSCIRCGNCVFFCPYQSAKLDSPGAVTFDLTLCRGCGLCVAICPALALDLENWERERISTIVTRLASEVKSPRVLVFRCQWAVFPSLNGVESLPNVRFIDMPCASRVDDSHVLEAFQKGADGVLIAACSEDDCKQEKSSGKTRHNMAKLSEKLAQIGLKDKLQFCTVAPRYPEHFAKELEQFCQKIGGVKESK